MTHAASVTHLTGVLGWPIGHSISPAMHNAAFAALGLDWRYLALAVHPDDLPAAFQGLRALRFAGVNVTIPHKIAVAALVDELSEEATAIGAVNMVTFDGRRALGHNTDAFGFLAALSAGSFTPDGCSAVVLGAGGAARAIVYALASVGARIAIHNRTAERAEGLTADLSRRPLRGSLRVIAAGDEDLAAALASADLLVNCTPVGMVGGPPGSPLPPSIRLRPGMTVFDAVYTPPLTPLLHQARRAGAQPIGGLGMLVHQAARAFATWTGLDAPAQVMERAARRALSLRRG